MKFNIFGDFQKNEYEDFVYIFGGSSQNWTTFRGLFYAIFGSFLKVKVQNGGIFWVAKISNIYLVCFKFLMLFCEL